MDDGQIEMQEPHYVPHYRRMLERYKERDKSPGKIHLSKQEIIDVLRAWGIA